MVITRDFHDTVAARVRQDRAFRRGFLKEGVECFLSGDVDTGKAILRDYIKATCGFPALSQETGIPSKSLIRMFSASGNPQAKNLFLVVAHLQRAEGIRLQVRPAKAA